MPSRYRDTSLGWRFLALAPLALAAETLDAARARAAMPAMPADACRIETVAGERYTLCSFAPGEARFTVRLRDFDGRPYARLSRLAKARPDAWFAMNGGMYHSDLGPVGLYVEDGTRGKEIALKRSWGNFGLLPNGVFWVDGARVGVSESRAFARSGRKPDFATQSGPMLVIDGKLHPRFKRTSDSYKIRNGVGVSRDGRVHFALSHGAVNFFAFATLFRDHLKTPNALFLDGTVSAMRASGFTRGGFWRELGPMIVVEPPIGATPTPRPERP